MNKAFQKEPDEGRPSNPLPDRPISSQPNLVTSEGLAQITGTAMAKATCGTIRLNLLKIGALVTTSVRRIRIAMASSCPYQDIFAHAHERLSAAAR